MDVEHDTPGRILEAACELFATQGYRDTTIQDICAAAEANVAAVNYYYRNKAFLYRKVWQRASDTLEEHYPSLPPEDRQEAWLEDFLDARVRAIHDNGPGGWFPRLVRREMADPTELAPELYREFIAPRRARLESVLRHLLGPAATDLAVRGCALNVSGLFVFLNMRRSRGAALTGEKAPSSAEVDHLARQTAAFAAAGVAALRRGLEGKQPS